MFGLLGFSLCIGLVAAIVGIYAKAQIQAATGQFLEQEWSERGAGIVIEQGQIRSFLFNRGICSDDDLKEMAKHENVLRLYAPKTQISDIGVKYLRNHPTLNYIDFSDTSLSDASLEYLSGLPGLGHLDVSNTRVTKGEIEKFKNNNPRVLVVD